MCYSGNCIYEDYLGNCKCKPFISSYPCVKGYYLKLIQRNIKKIKKLKDMKHIAILKYSRIIEI